MNDADLDQLVAQIYQAAAGQLPWEQPLNRLLQAVDGHAGHLVAFDRRRGDVMFSHIAGQGTPEIDLAYVRHYRRIDPHVPLLLASPGIWAHSHEVFSEAEVAVHPFYQEYLIPNGARWVSGCKLLFDDDYAVLLGLLRSTQQQPYQAHELAWLERLRVHMSAALQIHRHLLPLRRQANAGRALLDALPYAMLLVDAQGGIQHRNAAAQALLSEASALRERDGRLACRHHDDDAQLRALLGPLLRGELGARSSLRARRGAGEPALGLCLSRLDPAELMGSFGDQPLALLVAHDSARLPQPDRFLIAEVFALSPAETEVALLVCEGLDAEAIAERRNVGLGTVRTQIRQLLAKTGTSRQVDLVRQLLALERLG